MVSRIGGRFTVASMGALPLILGYITAQSAEPPAIEKLGKAIFYHDRELNERFLTVLT